MSGVDLAVLAALLVIAGFTVGWWLGGADRRGTQPPRLGPAVAAPPPTRPPPTRPQPTPPSSFGSVVALGPHGLPVGTIAQGGTFPDGSTASVLPRRLASASPLARALNQLGLADRTGIGTVTIHLTANAETLVWGARTEFVQTASDGSGPGGGSGGAAVEPITTIAHDVLAGLGPTVVWSALALALGQQYQREINGRLSALEQRLGDFSRRGSGRDRAELAAARTELREAAGRLLDGEPADGVDAGLDRLIQVVESRWAVVLGELASLRGALDALPDEGSLTREVLLSSLPTVFDRDDDFRATVRTGLAVLAASVELITVRAAQAAASAPGGPALNTAGLQQDIEAVRAALQLLAGLVHDLGWLRYNLAIGRLRRGREEVEHALQVTRQLLELHDCLRALQLPLLNTPLAAAEVVVARSADGSLSVASV